MARRRRRYRSVSPDSKLARRAYWQKLYEEDKREAKRQSRLTPEEKLKEDGDFLQSILERNATELILLQPCPPGRGRASCRAEGCIFAAETGSTDFTIQSDYRVVLSQSRRHYHVECVEKMLDLPSLAPSRFRLDLAGYRWNDGWPWNWSLMMKLWFERGGCISTTAFEECIRECRQYKETETRLGAEYLQWRLAHPCESSDGFCGCKCPLDEVMLVEPKLEDYEIDATEACLLSEMLGHPYAEEEPYGE